MQNAAIPSLLPVYKRNDITFERGEGARLWDAKGRGYLDFGAGIAVTGLGHCHPHIVKALQDQAATLWHVSNLYMTEPLQRLGDRLVANSFGDTVFVCNSGAEAIEVAVKMARRYWHHRGQPLRKRLVTFEGAFHGRTMTGISAVPTPKMAEGFEPLLDGFDVVPWGDHEALHAAIGDQTAGILIEPIQGEGGIRPVPDECLRGLRQLCDERDLLLIFDEVQCGLGRTGRLFAYEWAGVTPDIMPLAKGLGGGFPVGACVATARAASGMAYGTHGSTYGGNPLAASVANAVLDVMLERGFLAEVERKGELLRGNVEAIASRHPGAIANVRGKGLMLGLQTVEPVGDFVAKLHGAGLVTIPAADNIARLLPPLTITDAEIEEGCALLEGACLARAA